MSQRIPQIYQAFTGKAWAVQTASAEAGTGSTSPIGKSLDFLASMADTGHTILIRALLEQCRIQPAHASTRLLPAPVESAVAGPDQQPWMSAGPSAYALAQSRIEWLRTDASAKFLEYRDRWRKRLAYVQLQPFLMRNQWMTPVEGGLVVAGKGTRKDAKMLYLQVFHDMASDGERQVSSIGGMIFHLQGELTALWHKESINSNRSRLLPALESALRAKETELFKKARLSLGDLAMETFMDRVGKWEKRIYRDDAELFRLAAWPWYHPRYASGFEGFMEVFADLAQAVCNTMLDHYAAKWELFLRGLQPAGGDAFPPRRTTSPIASEENRIHVE